MTMNDHGEWIEKLSDYLDAELSVEEQRAVAAHVAGCSACARTLDELRAVVEHAGKLPAAAPSTDLWSGIAERIAAEGTRPSVASGWTRRRFSFTWAELAAATVVLVLISGWAALRLTPGMSRANVQPNNESAGRLADGANLDARPDVSLANVSVDDTEYDAAVADLQRALQNGRGRLDPTTVSVVEQNLTVIDQAVDEARRALAEDPANADLSGYLLETRRRKLDLLRHAAALSEDFN